jgi:2',3'-cyclic-nucleotide 2'-phosphodiesterase (5'-nucleotidase family)
VVDFDANGLITDIDDKTGAYATDDRGVDAVYGSDVDPRVVADPQVVAITDALGTVINSKDSKIFGETDVFLNGRREDVRTQETNLGNLTADANLFVAQQVDPTTVISLKNGGGIRDNIGTIQAAPGSLDPQRFCETTTACQSPSG